jgi:hypothetical protein
MYTSKTHVFVILCRHYLFVFTNCLIFFEIFRQICDLSVESLVTCPISFFFKENGDVLKERHKHGEKNNAPDNVRHNIYESRKIT